MTVAMPFLEKNANYTTIQTDPKGDIQSVLEMMTSPLVAKTESNVASALLRMSEIAIEMNENALNHPIMKQLLEDPNTTFDLVIVCKFMGGEPGYYLAHRWKAPTAIYVTAQSNLPFVSTAMGQPFNPAYNPLPVLPFLNPMTFLERVQNTLVSWIFEHVLINTIMMSRVNALLDKHFPGEERPSILDLEKNTSVAFTFGHPLILDGMSPATPNFVQLGMMNCRRPGKPFPTGDKIGTFLNNSKNGVILVSFGSVIRPSLLTAENQKILLNIFGRFPQYDFLWKWDLDSMEGKPDNVMLSKWLPQQDILAHPKLKVFVTHAGQSSFQETLCHQKPMVAICVLGDQLVNAREAERLGFGIAQPYQQLNEEDLYRALDTVLHDPKYSENARKFGSLVTDQITKPLDRAVWWIEHVMRHPKMYEGRSPVHQLFWFQYLLLDVFAFLALILYVIFKAVKFVFVKLCCSRLSNKSKRD